MPWKTASERNKIIKVYYRGQPYWCRNCSKQHTEKCPKLPKRMTPQEKINREKEVKTLIVADSQARMVNQDSLNADVILPCLERSLVILQTRLLGTRKLPNTTIL